MLLLGCSKHLKLPRGSSIRPVWEDGFPRSPNGLAAKRGKHLSINLDRLEWWYNGPQLPHNPPSKHCSGPNIGERRLKRMHALMLEHKIDAEFERGIKRDELGLRAASVEELRQQASSSRSYKLDSLPFE